MQLVIDLDWDTFVYPPVETGGDSYDRASSAEHQSSPRDFIEFFLQHQLKLSIDAPTPGAIFDFHEDSYRHLRNLIVAGDLKVPFEVIHVDAHDDLLAGMEVKYFFEDWVARKDKLNEVPLVLNSANYLGYAVANGWLGSLTWVRRKDTRAESLCWLFKDFDVRCGVLQTKRFEKGGVARAADNLLNGRLPTNYAGDVEVPFREEFFTHYEIPRPADFLFVARSPSFTPIEADANEDLIRTRIANLPTTDNRG